MLRSTNFLAGKSCDNGKKYSTPRQAAGDNAMRRRKDEICMPDN